MDRTSVTIVHALPGRLRVRLSRRPKTGGVVVDAVARHAGIRSIAYTATTRSVLVLYDPGVVTQDEIVLHIAVSISLDGGAEPVRILLEPEQASVTNGAVVSAGLILAAALSRRLGVGAQGLAQLDRAAGVATACAVLGHAWKEMREKGYFDPEVLSLGYLLSAFLRGEWFKAALVTWLMTHGRHLLEVPRVGVEVRPIEVPHGEDGEGRHEIIVSKDHEASKAPALVSLVRALIRYMVTGGGMHGREDFVKELREVSRVHGEVLEGLGRLPEGFLMRFH